MVSGLESRVGGALSGSEFDVPQTLPIPIALEREAV